MPDQLDIFGNAVPFPALEPRGFRAGNRGGSEAATKVPDQPEKYISMLNAFTNIEHWTDSDLAFVFYQIHPGTISKRRLRLERAGLVEQVEGLSRPTRHGIDAMVFRITDKGRGVLAQWERSNGKNHPAEPESTRSSSMSSRPTQGNGPSSAEQSPTPGD